LFPDYKVYVGQEALLVSQPSNIGEIFKIHGCCSKPNSLVITKADYDGFSTKRAYLAAKLLTIFVEHPIVFIGYSLQDKNIQGILSSMVVALGDRAVERLHENLIFIQRAKPG